MAGLRALIRLVGALVGAPMLLALGLTLLVLLSALTGDLGGWAALDRARNAALVFSQSLLAFNLTVGSVGVLLLLLAAERSLLAWAATGLLLGVVSAMAHGLMTGGVVRDVELVLGGALGALDLMLVRSLAGLGAGAGPGPDQRPS